MMRICDFKNHYTRCKKGWVYMPDGMGCVQSELCPKCDGEGKIPMTEADAKSKRWRQPPGYRYYQSFDVDVEVKYVKTFRVRAMNENHARDIAEKRARQTPLYYQRRSYRIDKSTCEFNPGAVIKIDLDK